MSLIDNLFEDKRLTSALMMTWLFVVIFIYSISSVGTHHVQFLHVGPSAETIVMGVVIDTWGKWYIISILAFLKTAMNEFVGDSLGPWIINTLQDEKTTTLPYSKGVCLLIVQLYTIYGHIMSVFGIALLLSQVDFLVIRIIADLSVTAFAMYRFMLHKTVRVYKEICSDTPTELDTMSSTEHSSSKLLPQA